MRAAGFWVKAHSSRIMMAGSFQSALANSAIPDAAMGPDRLRPLMATLADFLPGFLARPSGLVLELVNTFVVTKDPSLGILVFLTSFPICTSLR